MPEFGTADNKTAEFLTKSPLGRVPVLETPHGCIFESNAIARYVARMRRDTELCGATFFDGAQVDSWMDFCTHELELPATVWYYPVIGYMPHNDAAVAKAKADLAKGLKVLETHLLDKTYLVGDKITLADIAVASALVYPMKLVCDGEYRKAFPCVCRWFMTCVNQPQFVAVVGKVEFAKQELLASGATAAAKPAAAAAGGEKKEKKPKEPKEAAPKKEKAEKPKKDKDEEEDPPLVPVEKKEIHPLTVLDKEHPSPFVMDAWKKLYSNATDYDVCMNQFWELFDASGYCLYICRYQDNASLKKIFMTSNLVSGFVQRSGEIRKWAFGVMQITGSEETSIKVSGAWLLRGDSPQHLIQANDDANWYDWTKIATPVSDADKALIKEFWTSETTLEGEPIVDCKVFK